MSGTESSSRVGEVACGTCTRTHGLGMASFQDEVKGFLIQQILNALSPIAGIGSALVLPWYCPGTTTKRCSLPISLPL